MKFLTLGIIPLVVLHISSISATKPGQNVKMMALTMMGLREALCWKVVRVFWHYLNSFWPSLCKTGTVLHFFGPCFFLSDWRHGIKNKNIRSAFFQQWVYASNKQFCYLWKGTPATFNWVILANINDKSLSLKSATKAQWESSLTERKNCECCLLSQMILW